MAHVVSFTNGSTTLDLAGTTSGPGYVLIAYGAPRPARQLARVSGFPFVDGQRTVAASLLDVTAPFQVLVIGSDADDLDARVQALVKLVQAAQRWENERLGHPVRLLFKHDGATKTSYRTVTGVPLMPQPMMVQDLTWLDQAADCSILALEFTVTLEPVAHAGALTNAFTDGGVESNPGANLIPFTPVDGTMPAPFSIVLENDGLVDWQEVWIAQNLGAPLIQDYSGDVDADAWNGERNTLVFDDTEIEISSIPWIPDGNAPMRGMVRLKLVSGTPGVTQIQFRVTIGGAGDRVQAAPWLTLDAPVGEYKLIDLGTLRLPSLFKSRAHQDASSQVRPYVAARTSDGSTVQLGIDYFEVLPILSFVRLAATVANGDTLAYDLVLKDSAYYWPSRVPQSYAVLSDGGLIEDAERYGMLKALDPADFVVLWFALIPDGAHILTASANVALDYLATYSLGLMGND